MRKHTKRKHYALIDPIRHALMGCAVTDTASLNKLRMLELSAIESFRIGKATRDDWRSCADYLNIMETLCHDGVGPEALDACYAAQEALGAAQERFATLGRLVLTGPQLQALREAYAYHDAQRTSISRSRYEQAIATTANRIRSSHPSVKVCV